MWPKDTLAAKIAFYGDPRGTHGVNDKWYACNVIRIIPPWKMTFAGKPVSSISFHKKCADALKAALDEIWTACDKDQSIIEKHGLQEYGGSFSYRLIRGASSISNHSFAIAIDLSPSRNRLGTMGAMPAFAVKAFDHQGFRWGGNYKTRRDPMHWEAVSP